MTTRNDIRRIQQARAQGTPLTGDPSRTDASVGPGRLLAYAIAVFPGASIQRSVLRALLPAGENRKRTSMHGGSRNGASVAMGRALAVFTAVGWIEREQDLVRVLARRDLYDYATRNVGASPHFLQIETALKQAQAELQDAQRLSAGPLVAARRQQLRDLHALMQSHPGGVSRQAVRVVPRSRPI